MRVSPVIDAKSPADQETLNRRATLTRQMDALSPDPIVDSGANRPRGRDTDEILNDEQGSDTRSLVEPNTRQSQTKIGEPTAARALSISTAYTSVVGCGEPSWSMWKSMMTRSPQSGDRNGEHTKPLASV